MLNIIRADLYRIVRGKGVYITMILLIAFLILQVAARGSIEVFTVKIDGEEDEVYLREGRAELRDFEGSEIGYGWKPAEDYNFAFTGNEALIDTDILLYFLLPFIIFIAAADFSTEAVKNTLSNGMPRTKYYLSKLILACIFCLFVLLLNIIIPIIAVSIISIIPASEIEIDIQFVNIIKPFFAQLFLCLAVTCVGIFFVFVTKRTAAVNGSYIAFCMVPLMITFILYQINKDLQFLSDYELISNIRMLARIDAAESGDIIRAFIIGGFYILASTAGGILLFKRSEIK